MSEPIPTNNLQAKTADNLIAALRAQVDEWKELSGLPTPLTFASLEGASQSAKTLYEAADDLDVLLTERTPLSYEDEARADRLRIVALDARTRQPTPVAEGEPAPPTSETSGAGRPEPHAEDGACACPTSRRDTCYNARRPDPKPCHAVNITDQQAPVLDPDYCALSQRVDGKRHSWKFDGDDPHIICHYCEEMRDAMTGRVIRPAPVADPDDTNSEDQS